LTLLEEHPLCKIFPGFIVGVIKSEKEFYMAAKFEIFIDRKKQYRFHLKASNGETIAASQAYETKTACIKGIKSIQKNAPAAEIIDPEKAVKAVPAKRGSKAAASSAEAKEKKPRNRKPKTVPQA
jgi:uncharacterized protein YegP (UPF0339 family)